MGVDQATFSRRPRSKKATTVGKKFLALLSPLFPIARKRPKTFIIGPTIAKKKPRKRYKKETRNFFFPHRTYVVYVNSICCLDLGKALTGSEWGSPWLAQLDWHAILSTSSLFIHTRTILFVVCLLLLLLPLLHFGYREKNLCLERPWVALALIALCHKKVISCVKNFLFI